MTMRRERVTRSVSTVHGHRPTAEQWAALDLAHVVCVDRGYLHVRDTRPAMDGAVARVRSRRAGAMVARDAEGTWWRIWPEGGSW